jgi:hypothetical protein
MFVTGFVQLAYRELQWSKRQISYGKPYEYLRHARVVQYTLPTHAPF